MSGVFGLDQRTSSRMIILGLFSPGPVSRLPSHDTAGRTDRQAIDFPIGSLRMEATLRSALPPRKLKLELQNFNFLREWLS